MAAGKLLVLLLVGGLAGAAFAAMTTGTMRPYRVAEGSRAHGEGDVGAYAAPPDRRSWLDEGLSLLDSPAWPFGHGSGHDDAARIDPEDEGPYDYAPTRDDERDYGSHDAGNVYGDGGYDIAPSADRPAPAGPAPAEADAATDAASRAAAAAQDVIAAEHAN
ncbi:hypothetical protein [Novosphingobium sp. BL-52-GroH]|uniref:hypothetical protein n=1 Tax=Novosphingobium sp. BL-52-GroH TaxID=3349877 RepID=UPI00384ECD3D